MAQDSHETMMEPRTSMSISMTVEDKKLLKMYAAEKGVTVAALIHEWVQKNCKKGDN